jgi:GTP-binding protein HflX
LLLHVVDASNEAFEEQLIEVQRVLEDIGAAHVPQWLVFNKIDALAPDRLPFRRIDTYDFEGRELPRIFLSAKSTEGLDLLRDRLANWALNLEDAPGALALGAEDLGAFMSEPDSPTA